MKKKKEDLKSEVHGLDLFIILIKTNLFASSYILISLPGSDWEH